MSPAGKGPSFLRGNDIRGKRRLSHMQDKIVPYRIVLLFLDNKYLPR